MIKNERYHYFDYLRAIAMLLGIPLHACLAYGEIEYFWVLKDESHSHLIDQGLNFLRLFRMPLFFAISGFFTALTIDKGLFLQKRTKRLLYPLLVFFLLIVVPLKLAWLAMEVPDQLYALDIPFLIEHFKESFFAPSSNTQFRHSPNWGHLWFLLYLFFLSLLTVPVRKIFKIDFKKYSTILILSMSITFLSYFLMKSHWVDQPFKMYPLPSLVIYYGSFYFFGWQLFKFKEQSLSKTMAHSLLTVGSLLAILRSNLEVNSHLNFYKIAHSDWQLAVLATVATWSIVIGVIYTFKHHFNKENKSISYFVKGSYFIYLIHLPIIILLQILFNRLDSHWAIEFPLATLGSLFFSVLIYHYFIKGKFIDRFLKGSY